ncbi:uncharacterized protein EAF01_003747 [Botrytis porri]|uniref:uncharacterized protein n=1 Tax=Botrytis porri TaxID=87229 RepID=UPI0019015697|nr:uncharacterized protein EAF01_003747 [Botrytis porri]KAF7910029.1 hypothetical protein EAF01_003747 [Botrytis porri]
MMNDMSIPKASSSARSNATPSAQELRQKLLAQIFEYNTDANTPSELRIHVTGLTLEEGAIFERDSSPVIEKPGTQTPTNAPREGSSSLRNAALDIKSFPLKDSETSLNREASKSRELTHWRDAKIKLRDLQREKETLKMEGRRRAAKEQIDARWQDRALKDFRENKAEIKNDIMPGADGNDKVVITDVQYPKNRSRTGGVLSGNAIDERNERNIRHDEDSLRQSLIDIINGESGRQNGKTKSGRRRSPKAPTGTRQLAESRRKLNREWVESEGHRRAIRQDDESTRKNLLKSVNRAIATAERMVLKGAEQLMDFVNKDRAEENTTEVVSNSENKDSRLRDESPLAYARLGYSSPLSARNEPESRSRGGNGYAHGPIVDIPPQAFRSTQGEKDRPFVYRPREHIQIPPMSPLVPKVTQPRQRPNPKLEHLPVVFPVPAIRDSRLLLSESPAQWKIRTQREAAHAKFEREKSKYQGEVETANKSEQASPKGILRRDGKEKGKGIAWADNSTDFEDGDLSSMGKTLSFNQRADQEELRKLQEKRAMREGQYQCHATESTIERENLAAREKAKALAEKLMRGGGSSEDQRDLRAGK